MPPTTRLTRSVACLGAQDHACAVHRGDAERVAVSTAFVGGALAQRRKVVYTAADRSPDDVLREFEREGLDVRGHRSAGQLEVRVAADSYVAQGRFDPDDMIRTFGDELRAAAAAGWDGCSIAGEMAWATDHGASIDALLDYERRVDEIFWGAPATGLCLYDAERFDSRELDAVAACHPLLLSEPDAAATPGWARAAIERGADGTLAVAGEIDLTNASSLAASLRHEAARSPSVRLDLRDLTFIDVRGLTALYEVATERGREGERLTLVGAPPLARDVLEMLAGTDSPWLSWETI